MSLDIDDVRTSRKAGWLPASTGWPEVEELRERHVAAVAIHREASDALSAIRAKHDQEDAERKHALASAARAGKRPKLRQPDRAAREAELAGAQERLDAATEVLEEVYAEVLAALRELAPEAAARLQSAQAEAEEERRRAREAVLAAEREVLRVRHLAQWFDRTVNKSSSWRAAFDELPVPEPAPEPDWAAIIGTGGVIANA
ncbi:hypothetical protein [Miltoncostaea marina]|uniref:hypothetical protein n=1 Tax=Miltoncostaea marina TaxID=2843215 RepID=UPI001C3CDECA|nr:hypothetical protein [Miltoncostaea marina]